MKHNISLCFPIGLILDITVNDFKLLADYPVDRGGFNVAISPWEIFLTSIIACQGINIAKYCIDKGLDYYNIKVRLDPKVADTRNELFPEYHLHINLPAEFPDEEILGMVEFINNCPVTNHLTKLNPILKTFVDGELKIKNIRK